MNHSNFTDYFSENIFFTDESMEGKITDLITVNLSGSDLESKIFNYNFFTTIILSHAYNNQVLILVKFYFNKFDFTHKK